MLALEASAQWGGLKFRARVNVSAGTRVTCYASAGTRVPRHVFVGTRVPCHVPARIRIPRHASAGTRVPRCASSGTQVPCHVSGRCNFLPVLNRNCEFMWACGLSKTTNQTEKNLMSAFAQKPIVLYSISLKVTSVLIIFEVVAANQGL